MLLVPMETFNISFIFLSCTLSCYGYIDLEVLQDQCEKSDAAFNKSTEYVWLQNYLESIADDSSILWKIVFIHYPIFSINRKDGDTETLKKHLLPLLKQYGVDVLFAGHNHNMQYFVSMNNEETNKYQMQDKSDLCIDYDIMCGSERILCEDKNTSCHDKSINCSKKRTRVDSREYPKNVLSVTYVKREALHQVVMGASGADLDNLCLKLISPMAEFIFGLADYGFSEVTVTETELNIKYIHANSSKVVFESKITN